MSVKGNNEILQRINFGEIFKYIFWKHFWNWLKTVHVIKGFQKVNIYTSKVSNSELNNSVTTLHTTSPLVHMYPFNQTFYKYHSDVPILRKATVMDYWQLATIICSNHPHHP